MRRYSQNEIDELAEILNNDGVISIPTDTVYGVCARINSQKAFDNLVNAKHRPANKSFPVLCLNEEQIKFIADWAVVGFIQFWENREREFYKQLNKMKLK